MSRHLWSTQKVYKSTVAAKVSQAENSREELEKSLGNGKLVNEERAEIVKLSLEELQEKLQNDSLLCVDVLCAYQAKVFITGFNLSF